MKKTDWIQKLWDDVLDGLFDPDVVAEIKEYNGHKVEVKQWNMEHFEVRVTDEPNFPPVEVDGYPEACEVWVDEVPYYNWRAWIDEYV